MFDYYEYMIVQTCCSVNSSLVTGAKSDSLDRKTLKLKSSDEFLERMNNYINNGHYSNQTIEDFNWKINTSKELITSAAPSSPIGTETTNIVKGAGENSPNNTDQNSELFEGAKSNILFISGIVILIVITCIFVIIKKTRRKI